MQRFLNKKITYKTYRRSLLWGGVICLLAALALLLNACTSTPVASATAVIPTAGIVPTTESKNVGGFPTEAIPYLEALSLPGVVVESSGLSTACQINLIGNGQSISTNADNFSVLIEFVGYINPMEIVSIDRIETQFFDLDANPNLAIVEDTRDLRWDYLCSGIDGKINRYSILGQYSQAYRITIGGGQNYRVLGKTSWFKINQSEIKKIQKTPLP